MRRIEDLLAEQPFFKGMDQRWIAFFAGCAGNIKFDADEYIFREGGPADRFFLIRHGRVALETHMPQGGQVTIYTIGANDVVGWSWLYPPYRWTFDARAMEVVRAIGFDAACVRRKCEEDQALGYVLLKRLIPVITSRLQATRLQLLDVYGTAGGPRARRPA